VYLNFSTLRLGDKIGLHLQACFIQTGILLHDDFSFSKKARTRLKLVDTT